MAQNRLLVGRSHKHHYALVFLGLAIIFAILAIVGIEPENFPVAKILAFMCAILFVLFTLYHYIAGRKPGDHQL